MCEMSSHLALHLTSLQVFPVLEVIECRQKLQECCRSMVERSLLKNNYDLLICSLKKLMFWPKRPVSECVFPVFQEFSVYPSHSQWSYRGRRESFSCWHSHQCRRSRRVGWERRRFPGVAVPGAGAGIRPAEHDSPAVCSCDWTRVFGRSSLIGRDQSCHPWILWNKGRGRKELEIRW